MAEKAEKTTKAVDATKHGMNLHQKLAAITGDIGEVAKGGRMQGGAGQPSYDFIEYAAVAGKLRPLFAEYGVIIVPNMGDRTEKEITTSNGKKGVALLVDFTYDVINADKPDDSFQVKWKGEATDYGDKGTNKAATAALKSYFKAQFNISEKGDDPDGEHVDRGTASQSQPAQQGGGQGVSSANADKPITEGQRKKIFAMLSEKGFSGEQQKVIIHRWLKVDSTNDLTMATASALIEKIGETTAEAMQKLLVESITPEQRQAIGELIAANIEGIDQAGIVNVVKATAAIDNPLKLSKSDADKLIETLKHYGTSDWEMAKALLVESENDTKPAKTTDTVPTDAEVDNFNIDELPGEGAA